ncbi:tryptophan--tRNA ligase [bacterium]|nr:tryptophan--tRNA ligase [bacterium]
MQSLITGIKPTGKIHLGNYFGAFKPAFEFQKDYQSYIFLANLHALNQIQDGKELKETSFDLCANLISLGLDTENSNFFLQSDVPEHAELCWILSTICSFGVLERAHAWKDFKNKGLKDPKLGLFSYPVLMAADILLYNVDIVPVGKDQKQHVEIARDLAHKFNGIYGDTFILPTPVIQKEVETITGIDGQKMSKSYDNIIAIFEDENLVKKSIMKIQTDSLPVDAVKDPNTCNIFQIYKHMANTQELANFKDKYLAGGLSYGEAKNTLFDKFMVYFKEARAKKVKLLEKPDQIHQILEKGKLQAKKRAQTTLNLVKEKTGLTL